MKRIMNLTACVVAAFGAFSAMSAPLTEGQLTRQMGRTAKATWQTRAPDQHTAAAALIGGAESEGPADLATQLEVLSTAQLGGELEDLENSLPAHFDWREQPDGSYMPPVGAQGECGSCVSFAAIAAIEAQLNIACSTPQRSFSLSNQYFFSCGGGSCKTGWKLTDAVKFLTDHGVPDASCLAYSAYEDGKDVPCTTACADASQRLVRGITTTRPTTGYINVDVVKRELLNGPLLANMILFEDLRFYATGVYRHVTGRQLGSHAIVLVGWNDEEKAWIARNSWGDTWGDGGYFKVAWDDTTLPARYTWAFDVSAAKSNGACSWPR